jgi:heptosyltransferase-2
MLMPDNHDTSILVRGVNWVGDAVMTIPAIRALRKACPGAHISLLVKPSVRPVFEAEPAVDEIIDYDDRFRGIRGKISLAAFLRKRKFSRAILLQNAFDAALLAFLAGIPERTGYNRDGRGLLLTRPVACDGADRKVHHIQYYLNLLAAAGIRAEYTHPRIHLLPEEREKARESLSRLRRPVLGINPGAAFGSAKRWLPGRFAGVASLFIRDTGGSVVIFGGGGETDIAKEIVAGRESADMLDLAGKTSLRELIGLISECDVFLTNDSGPMHIAYAVGTPLAALFGSTDPLLTGPVGEGNAIIRKAFDCGPCFKRTCARKDLRCMYAITADEVYESIRKILPQRKAVFFDRDGTLCKDADYLNAWENFELFPDIGEVLKLKAAGFSLFGVSNQSGICRGIVDEPFVKQVNDTFLDKYGFDDFYYCPHCPEDHCCCRKPEPGMLLSARAKHGIDLRASYVVGDKDDDMLLAKAVGAKGILVKTGKKMGSIHACHTSDNLKDVVEYIITHG